MKYGIISDIHSNYDAFIVAINLLKNEQVDKIYCCGDIVGYGPQPNECIELIKKENVESIIGNHDVAVIGKSDLNWFNEYARDAILINKSIISKGSLDFLENLKERIILNNILFVHGSPIDNVYEYLDTISALRRNVKFMKQQICFCGHTHIPYVYSYDLVSNKDEVVILSDNEELKIDTSKKYIINVGSVGQPRDGDNRLCVLIYDFDKQIIMYKRAEYNIYSTQTKMKILNLPEFLITRLEFGK